MATKSTKPGEAATAQKPAAKKVAVAKFADPRDKTKAEALATMALRPSVNAAAVVIEYTKPLGEQDIRALVDRWPTRLRSWRTAIWRVARRCCTGRRTRCKRSS